MKRYLFIYLISLFFLTSCSSRNLLGNYMPYNEIHDNYSLDDAKKDDCVVYENLRITSGQSIWNDFVKQAGAGNPCFVRLAFYYTIDEPERYDPDYYEQVKYDYPALYIQDLEYDGEKYTLSFAEGEEQYLFDYEYMKKFTGKTTSPYATFSQYTYYVLVNDDTVAWERIEKGLISALSTDFVNYKMVYINLI